MRTGSRAACGLLLLITLVPRAAVADGAFPDELQVFVPADQPSRTLLTTNFGLLISDDAGASWRWVCEAAVTSGLAVLYQISAPPARTLLAAATNGLYLSQDGGCTWGAARGPVLGSYVPDLFPDPQ